EREIGCMAGNVDGLANGVFRSVVMSDVPPAQESTGHDERKSPRLPGTALTMRLWKDVRFWIWPVMVLVAWFLSRTWTPSAVLWESRPEAPASVIVVQTVEGLVWPGALLIAALVGLGRAWMGRSA